MTDPRSEPDADQILNLSPDALWHRIAWCKGEFPEAEIKRAIQIPEQIVPLIMGTFEKLLAEPEPFIDDHDFYGVSLGFLLLAQFREPRGFPLAVRLLHLDRDKLDALISDMLTEDFPAVLASTFNGDLDALKHLYEDEELDEFVRIAGLRAMGALFNNGIMTRLDLSNYIRDALLRLRREPSYVWDTLIAVASDFRFAEHREAVLKLYDDGIADPDWDRKQDVAKRFDSEPKGYELSRYRLVNDVVSEASWWACFGGRGDSESQPWAEDTWPPANMAGNPSKTDDESQPFVRDVAKVRRNDPCPCGSGKKYKKCCGS